MSKIIFKIITLVVSGTVGIILTLKFYDWKLLLILFLLLWSNNTSMNMNK